MTAVQKHLGICALLLSNAVAQSPAARVTVQDVSAQPIATGVRVEITLSSAVRPSVQIAVHPDRILLDLPDTSCGDNTQDVEVNAQGVRRVRAAQHSTKPMVTRVVLDLDQARAYSVSEEGNHVVVLVGAAQKPRNSRGAPAAAASGSLMGVFRRQRDTVTPITLDETASTGLPAPPPSPSGPAFEPPHSASGQPAPPAGGSIASAAPATMTASPSSLAQGSFTQNQIAVATPGNSGGKAASGESFPSRDTAPPAAPAPAPAPSTPEASPSTTAAAEPTPETSVPAANAAAPESAAPARTMIARSDDPNLRTVFKVKYVAEGVAYLEGGRAQGLAEGMKLEVEETNLPARQGESASSADPRVVAELEVTAVAESSAVTDIHTPKRPVVAGDLAYLSSEDAAAMVQQRALSATRQYPAVISFTEGDTLDEEERELVPRPPLPSVNRARGRIGFDSMETISHGLTSVTSTDIGIVFRGDITRIGGTFWNLSGYWRGRLTKQSAASQQTLQSLINRTYHLNMTYDNPNSQLVAGFGRLYLPWAPSLDTIDGGYFGRRMGHGSTIGIFAGSTPDPSSWDYSPDRVIGGAFINFEGGGYDRFHYSATSGLGISMVKWAIDRPFIFFEDSVSYKRDIAVYESAQFDSPRGNSVAPAPGPGLGRNFFTLRVNPHPRVEVDFNYNYFRDIPTFDPTLISVDPSLLSKFLFQGFSAGGRVEVAKQIWLSTNLGRSSRTGDTKASLNEMYGITFGRLPWIALRADAHYAKFDSSFGSGSYESVSLSRQLSERLRLEVLLGQQNFASTVTTANRARFLTGTVETVFGPHYYLQSSFTTNRGDLSYDQFMFSLGYRFDSKRRGEK
jgi:hypothetical protein